MCNILRSGWRCPTLPAEDEVRCFRVSGSITVEIVPGTCTYEQSLDVARAFWPWFTSSTPDIVMLTTQASCT